MTGSALLPWRMFGQETPVAERQKRDRNKVVILSDAHVGVSSGQWQRDGLAARIATILQMDPLPGRGFETADRFGIIFARGD